MAINPEFQKLQNINKRYGGIQFRYKSSHLTMPNSFGRELRWYYQNYRMLMQSRPELWNHWILVILPEGQDELTGNAVIEDIGDTRIDMDEASGLTRGRPCGYLVFFGDKTVYENLPIIDEPPLPPACDELVRLTTWYANNLSTLAASDMNGSWVLMECGTDGSSDGDVRCRKFPETNAPSSSVLSVDDLVEHIPSTPSHTCRLIAPVGLDPVLTYSQTSFGVPSSRRHHVVEVIEQVFNTVLFRSLSFC